MEKIIEKKGMENTLDLTLEEKFSFSKVNQQQYFPDFYKIEEKREYKGKIKSIIFKKITNDKKEIIEISDSESIENSNIKTINTINNEYPNNYLLQQISSKKSIVRKKFEKINLFCLSKNISNNFPLLEFNQFSKIEE